jgi:TolB-like protein/cytochrome c-type biogenesis protein CcmH/NrfG
VSFLAELKRRNVFRAAAAYVILAWLVLQVSDVILSNIAAPAWVFRVLLLFLAVGLPFVLFFAWAFELTPEGLKRESEVDRSQSITPHTGKKLDRMIIVVLLLALGYFAYDKFVLSPSSDEGTKVQTAAAPAPAAPPVAAEPDNSIAVLPFVNISDDAGNEYFSDGLSEELLNLLAKIPELRVAARTSSFSFKGQQLEIPEIAARLRVAHILEGSVRKAGNQVRITAQLIKADDGFHLWSETYDRTLDNIFVMQDEIAAAVVGALKISLLGAAPVAAEVNPQAYALFLQARYLFNQRSRENYEKSARAYRQALDLDPDYAAAWAGLASVTVNQAGYNYIDLDSGVQQARAAAERAIELDPGLAAAWASLAQIQGFYEFNWNGAYESAQKALQLEPANSEVLAQAARLASSLGKFDQDLAYSAQAVDLDPLNYAALNGLSSAYEQAGRLDEAEKTIRHLLTLNPGFAGAHSTLAYILLRQGKAEQALVESETEREDFWRSLSKAITLHTLGRKAEADAELASFIELNHEFGAYQIAEIHAWRNEPDEAFQWLEKAYQQRDPGLGALLNDTSIMNLHQDPRWQPLLEKVGLLDAWKASDDVKNNRLQEPGKND